jgi:fructokinase
MYLVCGEALFDLFLVGSDGPGAVTFDARAGGSPFNVAIGITRQGGRSALLTGISEDLLGNRLVSALAREGVATGYLVRSGRRTTLSLVDLSAAGTPAYAFYGLGSADCSLGIGDLPAIGDEISGLHFGSYSIVVPPVADAFLELARREERRFISLDPNIRPTVEPRIPVWRERLSALVPYADLLKASAEDLGLLFPGESPEGVAGRLIEAGVCLVVVTDGPNEVRAFRRGESVSVRPPPVEVVDTVGAGDAFQAALLASLGKEGEPQRRLQQLSTSELEAILARAAGVAAATCARRGAEIPRLAQ